MEEDLQNTRQRRSNKRPRVLVACQRCKGRRQKCDNASPECSNCSRARAACVYSDSAYPSSYVNRLEERVRELEARLSAHGQPQRSHIQRQRTTLDDHFSASDDAVSPQPQHREPKVQGPAEPLAHGLGLLSSCAAAEPHYFGFSAGLSLAHFVQVAIDSGDSSADVSLPLLADRPFSNKALNAETTLAPLPSFKTGSSYIRAYLSLVHPLYPFLDRYSLWQLHGSFTQRQEHLPISQRPIDIALMHLVYAIGSRCLQLLGKMDISKNTPEGHFLSAMKAISDDLKFTSIRSIEVTLLLAIHSMRSPSGTSVWHLSGLAIRQSLELGLHKQRMVDSKNVQLDQFRKRLFWSVYVFERKTALVLGRPFAISDEDIDLDLPMNVDEDQEEERDLVAALGKEASFQPVERKTLSFHIFHVQLYQIHTQIRLALQQLKRTGTKEEVQRRMTGLFEQLESWQEQVLSIYDVHLQGRSTPLKPRNVREAQETLDDETNSSNDDQTMQRRPIKVEKAELLLEYHKARRSLLQPLMTEGREIFPFDTTHYIACADASGQICQLYRRLHRLSPIPFSLRDLHAVFVAGFTLIYCVRTCPSIYSAQRANDVGACLTVLYVITEQWRSAKKYRDAFEAVAENLMESAREYQENSATGSSHSFVAQASGDKTISIGGMRGPPDNNLQTRSYSANGRREVIDATLSSHDHADSVHEPANLPETENAISHHNEDYVVPTSNLGIELDLEYDFNNIEEILSEEGLEWFTGAVL